MAVLSVSVIFFTFALGAWVMGLYLIGMGSEPAEDGPNPLVSVGWIELIVGILLATQVFILVQQADGAALILILAGLVALFAVFFTALGAALITGADLRPVGNLAIPVAVLAGFYVSFDLFDTIFLFQSQAIVWLVGFLLIAGFTYGKVSAKLLGWSLVLVALWGFAPAVYLALNLDIP
ncbi:MAG: hypothetical protein IH943_02730 [Acidobacteria bacterium]|nr:hypothetical protein [Acidobacteriota bacterium]